MAQILRCRAVLSGWSGAPALYTAYFSPGTAGGSVADATDCLARVRGFWNAMTAQLPAAVQITTAPTVDVLEASTGELVGQYASSAPPTVVTGTSVAEFYAPGNYALLQINTLGFRNGRKVRGRSFIGPITEAGVTSGVANSTLTSLVSASAAAQLTPSSPATASAMVVWSRPSRGGSNGATNVVISFACPSKLAMLRSRRD